MENFRGREARVQAAEAFVVLPAAPARGVAMELLQPYAQMK
jgi:hypothetical protein